ncbi:DeoR/GlpR family DNA-binding transcription regulator [Microbacterium sp. B19]|uniref:DeoR/GlpR family DNA-binding transcription regulator n=1 Tax=Microbacterium sp. B19 TaxID=96765 RepID=UPI00034D8A5D|nr:DeoR/GlpR family DNA-binding transcription regulator [Microbacterium sp. B19]
MTTSPPLIPEQRQRELMRLLRGSGALSIRHLASLLGVSHMTVRRDIAVLEEEGLVDAVQGGVRLRERVGVEPPRERGSRAVLELPRKEAVARRAADLVSDGMTLFIDAGTTCQAIVPHLTSRRGLTVVTNDFFTVSSLFAHPSIEVIHTGGVVDAASGSSSGALAAATVAAMTLDLALLSTGTWDVAHGLTTPELDKVVLKRAVMDASGSCALVADSTKYGTAERFRVVPLDALDVIVSDRGLPDGVADAIAELGVELWTADD